MPIFVYRCECGNRFERLVPRDATAPDCPSCGSVTRKIPAGPRLGRAAGVNPPATARPAGGAGSAGSAVPIPWRGVVSGGPEKMAREVEFRQQLEAKAVRGIRVPGGPTSGADQGSVGPSNPSSSAPSTTD